MKFITATNSVILCTSIALIPKVADSQTATNNNEQTILLNSNLLTNPSTFVTYLEPFNLVTLAYQGGLVQQGIPSGGTLIFETQNKNIIATDLVKAAVNADRLPLAVLNDHNYLSAVNLELQALPDYGATD